MAVGLADPDAGGVVKDCKLGVFVFAACVMVFALAMANLYAGYRVGYADGVRASAPLAAPPTKTERAR